MGLFAVLALAVVLPALIRAAAGAVKADTASTTSAPPSGPTSSTATVASGGAPSTAASAEGESPKMTVNISSCFRAGDGYTFRFVWPGYLDQSRPAAVGYVVTIQRNEEPPVMYRWDDSGDTGPPNLKGQPPNTQVRVAVASVLSDGTTRAPSMRVVRSPADAC
jgi:hypothetical protein